MKRGVLLVTFLVIAMGFAGCLSGSITFTIVPNPIVFTADETTADITLELKTQGFGKLVLENIIIEVTDEEEEVVYTYTEAIDEEFGFVVPGIKQTHEDTLDLADVFAEEGFDATYYNEYLLDKEYLLTITLTGSKDVIKTAVIKFN